MDRAAPALQQAAGWRRHRSGVAQARSLVSAFVSIGIQGERSPEKNRDEESEDNDFLECAAPEGGKPLEQADEDRAECRHRVARHGADDGTNEGLEPDEEA